MLMQKPHFFFHCILFRCSSWIITSIIKFLFCQTYFEHIFKLLTSLECIKINIKWDLFFLFYWNILSCACAFSIFFPLFDCTQQYFYLLLFRAYKVLWTRKIKNQKIFWIAVRATANRTKYQTMYRKEHALH